MNNPWGLICLFVPAIAMAQPDSIPPSASGLTHRIQLGLAGAYDSNVLFNDLTAGLYQGGVLSPEVRQRSLDAMGGPGLAGFGLSGSLTYSWGTSLFGKEDLAPRIRISHESHMGVRFAEDAYKLAFFGNRDLAGRTAQLGGSTYEQVSYQVLSFGMYGRKSGSYVELGVVNGRGLNRATIRKADLYTAPDGRFLDLDLDGTYQRSDTADGTFSSGMGIAVSFEWNRPLHLFGRPATLTLGAVDLGFIGWNGNSLSAEKDSILHFEGFRVTGILDLDDLLINEQSFQDSLGLGYTPGKLSSVLPALLRAKLGFGRSRVDELGHTRHLYALEVDQRILPAYRPHVSITREIRLSRAFTTGIGVGYGGFGGFKVGLRADAQLGKHINLTLATANAIGLASNQARGKALALRMEVAW